MIKVGQYGGRPCDTSYLARCISQNKMPIYKVTMNIGGEGKEVKIIILGGQLLIHGYYKEKLELHLFAFFLRRWQLLMVINLSNQHPPSPPKPKQKPTIHTSHNLTFLFILRITLLANPRKLKVILTKDLVSLYFNNKCIWPSQRSLSQLGCIHGKKPRLKIVTK